MPFDMARCISSMTIVPSTTKPVAMVNAISVKWFTEKAAKVHCAEGADERDRNRDVYQRARTLRRNTNTMRIIGMTAMVSALRYP
jgi:hypothetical protein